MAIALQTAVPTPIEPGLEMDALRRFHRDVRWTGTIAADAMGPGTPPMAATGSGRHELIQDGRWIVGTYEQDQFLEDGTFVLKWQLHWVAGWDPAARVYRAALADSHGHADVMHGHIDGDRLTFESVGDQPVRIRLTWKISPDASLRWRNEMSFHGGPWQLVEQYDCTPM